LRCWRTFNPAGKVNLIGQNQIGRHKFVRPVVSNVVDALRCAAVSASRLESAEGNRIAPRHGPKRCRYSSLYHLRERVGRSHGPNLCLYSTDVMKALTISAFTKLPLN